MQKSRASFTVFFEDPFWVGVYEREEPGGLTACRVVFGAEPKDGEIYEWMLQNWAQLHFGPPLADARRPRAENPKRARRMARRSLAVQGVGTKAQQALALARGAGKQARTAARREQEQADRERRFALRVQRRKRLTGQVKACLCFSNCRKNKEVKESPGKKLAVAKPPCIFAQPKYPSHAANAAKR